MKYMLFLASWLAAAAAAGDDAVGWMRVSVPSNDVGVAALPFCPFPGQYVGALLSGPFVGDGGNASDALVVVSAADGARTGLVYSASGWLDPATGEEAQIPAFPGDALLLAPADPQPFEFYVSGLFPLAGLSQCAAPLFTGIEIDWTNSAARLSIDTGGAPADLLASDFVDFASGAASWRHLARLPAAGGLTAWYGALGPSAVSNGLYLVSDAARDSDGDGIPDGVERFVYGTSPALADTDGDGICDGLEVAWGMDPLLDDGAGSWRFHEPFELPDVRLGELSGQHGWRVSEPSAAVVQTKTARSGRAALRLSSTNDNMAVVLEQAVSGATGDVVWVDFFLEALPADFSTASAAGRIGCAGLFFLRDGHPVALDGTAFRTNESATVSLGEWVRCTFRLDFPRRAWDLYIDGRMAFEGLGMSPSSGGFGRFSTFGGGEAVVDDLVVSGTRPPGLSSDGDALPDEWEFRHFGSLDRDGSGDADGDGLSDLEEFRRRTNPLAADTDGDGLSDAVEVDFYGTSPISADSDGDGAPDMSEIADGTDPLSAAGTCQADFSESFELPDVSLGRLDGQNGWSVSRPSTAVVQDSSVRTGAAALKVVDGGAGGVVKLLHPVANAGSAVWVDIYTFALPSDPDSTAGMSGVFFDRAGHPVVCSDGALLTNRFVSVELGGWARMTMRLDYGNRTWDVYVAGILAGAGLPMSDSVGASFEGLGLAGPGEARIDDFAVSSSRPQGLSSDGDALPDE